MLVSYNGLLDSVREIYTHMGVGEEDAAWIAQCLTDTEAKGVYSHGIHLLKSYIEVLANGATNIKPQIRYISESESAARVDGDNGIGQVVMRDIMKHAIDKAKKTGSAVISGTNINHYGAGLVYADMAVKEGLIISLYASAIAMLAPFGAKAALFGTNPLTFGVPTGEMHPYILDMACSVGAANKLMIFASNNQQVPEGWGVDRNGEPTTDPEEILKHGCMVPFGGIKGSGIAGMVGLMSTIMSGAAFEVDSKMPRNAGEKPDYGMTVQLIDVSKFMPVEEFKARADKYLTNFVSLPPREEGQKVLYPGYLEGERLAKAKKEGVNVLDSTIEELRYSGGIAGVDVDKLLGAAL